jgi:uncharacterized protein YqgC (DUF456 family)
MNAAMTAAYGLVAILLLAGLVGSILPFLPGTPLILAGSLLYAVVTDFDPIGVGRLLILTGIAALAYSLDYLAGAVGVKKLGGSRWAMAGAVVGAVVGIFFGPLGIILGPILGAVGLELLVSRELGTSVRSGFGTVLGMLFGLAIKFSLAVVMVGLFIWWIWQP